MSSLLQPAPGTRIPRRAQAGADKRATLLVVVAFALTIAAIVGLPGPSSWFRGAAPGVAIVCGVPALIGMVMERFRGGYARLLLCAGAAALVAFGASYMGRAETARIVIAYFIPAALFLLAAATLAAPRMRANAT